MPELHVRWLVPLLSIPLLTLLIVSVWFYLPRERAYRLMTRWGLIRWEIANAFAVFVVASLFILIAACADAQTPASAAVTATVVDWTPLFNKVIELVAAVLAGLIVALANRAVSLLQNAHALNAGQLHMASIADLAAQLAGWVAVQIEAIADPQLKISMKSSLLAKAAQMLVDQAPVAIDATGLTPAGAKAMIELKLDPPDPVIPPPAQPAPAS